MCRLRGWLLFAVVAFLTSAPLAAQEGTALRVFLDCQTFCDQTFIRQEIHWIDWVRDRQDAEVQVLATGRGTGGGGQEVTLAYIGLSEFDGVDDEIIFTTNADATRDERREALSQYLTLGLARYVARTPSASRLTVTVPRAGVPGGPGGRGGSTQVADPADDPWNFWVFNVGVNGFQFGSSSSSDKNYRGSFSASRTTEMWKFSVSASYNENSSEFQFSDGSRFTTNRDSWSSNALLVRSIGGQWALGARARLGANTFSNYDRFFELEPGIEYNFFPYAESSRRRFTAQYTFAFNNWDYEEETIYGELEESRWQHALALNLNLAQPWGSTNFSLTGSQYLHDTDFYNVRIGGRLNVRLIRGLSLNVGGGYRWIRDQLSLRAGDLTDEDILTRQRQQATSYSYDLNFGFSYRFGSIFNNIVNPRFGGGGGGGNVIFF